MPHKARATDLAGIMDAILRRADTTVVSIRPSSTRSSCHQESLSMFPNKPLCNGSELDK